MKKINAFLIALFGVLTIVSSISLVAKFYKKDTSRTTKKAPYFYDEERKQYMLTEEERELTEQERKELEKILNEQEEMEEEME